jgi:hypothetical protein
VAGAGVLERVFEGVRTGVDERVIGHHRLDRIAALFAEPGERSGKGRGGGRDRLLRHPGIDRLNERKPPSRSELGVSVKLHAGPPPRRELW